ncbi:MAG: amidohydrolase family protein [Verrucomicrobia bacterium]|nr:amidohydrolase family protein [Verrucomicrobiota bacterium]
MRIDSHQHFWIYDASEYPWMTDRLAAIRRDFLPADLQREQAKVSLDGSIAVQARQSLKESRWLLELAEREPVIHGVVGWVDLQSVEVWQQLAELAPHGKFVGVRHVVQDEPEDNFMLRPAFLRGIGQLKQFELAYDLLVFPRQLPAAIQLARQFPEQRFVLDHLAKPAIKAGKLAPWERDLRELAKSPNVFCKISGMVTEADWSAWRPADFRPCLDVVFAAFGEDRVMFGSDWPVCLLAASYEEVFGIARDYFCQFSAATQAKFFGGNAARFYRLE